MTSAGSTETVREETATAKVTPVQGNAPGLDFAGEIQDLIKGLLRDFTSSGGLTVDYGALGASDGFRAYAEKSNDLSMFDPALFENRDEKLAFWINIHNMTVISRVIKLEIKDSAWENRGFFSQDACRVGGFGYSLDDIGNGILRGNARKTLRPMRQFFMWDVRSRLKVEPVDAGICFTLARGSRSCPPLHFYQAEKIEAQLYTAANDFVNGGGAVLDRNAKTLSISRLFKWRSADFGGDQGIMKFIANHFGSAEDAALLRSHASSLKVTCQDYDRGLNSSS